MPEAPVEPSEQADNALFLLVFSGAYEEVIRRAAAPYSDSEAPAIIAALAFGGRLEEAESVFEARFRGADRAAAPASARFFLAAGWCHAGNTERALRFVKDNVAALYGGPPIERYWAYQGLALVRHFEGRLRRSRRAARRALQRSIEAEFAYGRFLSLDLLAHAAVQLGEIHAGVRLLAQAAELADSLGYAENAATERATQVLFRLRFQLDASDAAIARVEELVAEQGVSYFARRNGWLELASARALRGEGARAAAALEEARRIALPGSDRRARVRWLIAHAWCMALSRSAAAARVSLDEALKEAHDELALRVEIGFVEALFCRPLSAQAELELLRHCAATGSGRARVAAALAGSTPPPFAPRIEDGLCRLLLECLALTPTERVRRLLREQFLGLIPWALGRDPGRSIIVLGTTVISENLGDVRSAELKHRTSLKLLSSLAQGYRSRAELLKDVWNIAHFSPVRHTPTLHTAVSRLRLALTLPDWIVTHDDGYALAAGIELLMLESASTPGTSEAELLPSLPPPDEKTRVLQYVRRAGTASSMEVARELRISSSTALRVLRGLCSEGLLEKFGGGRSTRYRCVPDAD